MPAAHMISAVSGARIFDGERFLEGHSVVIEGEHLSQVVPDGELGIESNIVRLNGGILAPGFIDIQVNGGGGVMFNNAPSLDTVNTIAAGHRPTGTTGMMPTLISDTREVQQAGIEAVVAARTAGNQSVMGIHIEGPFFSLARRGTHQAGMIRQLRQQDVEWLCSLPALPIILTLAPEQTAPGQIRRLTEAGIRVFAGHTNASYDRIQLALDEGLQGFTHLFNAMSPLTAREPGTVGAALDSADTWIGIIADGYHVHPASIRIAHRASSTGKLLLVTDAMATVGGSEPYFEIYGERIELQDDRLINAEGVMAGSAIGMIDAVRIITGQVGLPLSEALRMASLYPASFLGLADTLGHIAEGYRADMVHFDEDFRVGATWVAGQYQSHSVEGLR